MLFRQFEYYFKWLTTSVYTVITYNFCSFNPVYCRIVDFMQQWPEDTTVQQSADYNALSVNQMMWLS